MFESEDDDAIEVGVCRDEACPLEYVHQSHVYRIPSEEKPKGPKPRAWWKQRDPMAHLKQDPQGLREVMERAFTITDWPLGFGDVVAAVRANYGSTSLRTLHRYVEKMIGQRFIVALDLGLMHVAYIRHDSPRRGDLDNLRQYMLGVRSGALDLNGHVQGLPALRYA